MNYCCHDNYTLTGSHDPLDVNILNAYVQYLQSTGNVPPSDIPTFLTFYEGKVASGAVADLGNKTIGVLPEMDCANFIETGTIDPLDVNILNAYVQYMQSTGNQKPSDVATFLTFYEGKVASGAVAGLGSKEIAHLPTLESDTHIITKDGLVDKGCQKPECTVFVETNNGIATISINFDYISDPANVTNGKLSALEVVFDNLEFEPKATTNPTDIGIGDEEIIADWDVSNEEIEGFIEKTGVLYDLSLRDNGTLPTQKYTVFALLSTETSLTLSNFTGQTIKFEVPITNAPASDDEIVISEIRTFDSSTSLNRFKVVYCNAETLPMICCSQMSETSVITNGIGEDVNGVSILGSPGVNGSLCWNTFTNPSLVSQFGILIGDTGNRLDLGITAVVDTSNNRLRFTDENGNCYEGNLTSQVDDNVLRKI